MRTILSLLWLCGFVWSVALVVFVHRIPTHRMGDATHTDAIIVLTGGSLRVPYGLHLLLEGHADALLISGVGKKATLHSLLRENLTPDERTALLAKNPLIVLDYASENTRHNAQASAEFIRTHNFKTVRLVTANYHMQRSLLELQYAVPDVQVIADAVYPTAFRRDLWWRDATTRRLVLSEFHKTWLATFRHALGVNP